MHVLEICDVSSVHQRQQALEYSTYNSEITLQITITSVRARIEMLSDFVARKFRQCR